MKLGSGLALPAAALVVASALLAAAGPLERRPAFVLGAYLVAGAAWAWALARARRVAVDLRLVVGVAVLLRILALGSTAGTSDDAWRLLWEGEVVLAGRSPYAFAPDDPALADLQRAHPELYARVNHPEVAATYPPLVQLAGAGAAALVRATGPNEPERGLLALRAAFAALDLLLLVPLLALVRRRGLADGALVAWAWCPLAAFEIAGAGHLEGLALPLLVAALALGEARADARRTLGAALLFAGAVLSKLLPAALLPWFARAGEPPARWLGRAALVVCACALAYLPFLLLAGGERGLFGGLGDYAFRWEGQSLLHRFVEGAFARRYEHDLSGTDPRRLARAALLAAWLAWAVRTWLRERDPARAALDLFGAWIVVSPTFHPWYALWVVPWLALRPSPAFVWLAAAAPLAFAPVVRWRAEGVWDEPAWLWPVLALPLALLLARAWRGAHPRRTA